MLPRQEAHRLQTSQALQVLQLRSHPRPNVMVTNANLYSKRKIVLPTDKLWYVMLRRQR